MKHILSLSALTTAMLLLSGCGGGGGTGSTASRTGNVGDGYIEGAYVCHDSNHDANCLDEIYATTAADGSFTLSNYDPNLDLLVQVPVGAIDNGPFADGSTAPRTISSPIFYFFPAHANPSNAPIFVGPLSTLVYGTLRVHPGMPVDTATHVVATGLGLDADTLLDDYLDGGQSEVNSTTHIAAEIVSGALANTTTTAGGTTTPNLDVVLGDMGNIGSAAQSADPTSGSYDPGSYTPAGGVPASTSVSLGYQAVADLHADLLNCNYHAFEEWDITGGTTQEHKKLCLTTDADTGTKKLTYTEHYYSAGAWTMDTMQTSGQLPFLSRPSDTLVSMDHVNSAANSIYPLRFFPATELSYSGGSAIFESGILKYQLIVSEANISGLSGSVLPQGSSLAPLVDQVTYGAGDKLYKATMVTQTKLYRVDNSTISSSVPAPPQLAREAISCMTKVRWEAVFLLLLCQTAPGS